MEGLSRGYTKMKKEIIQNEKRKRQEDGKSTGPGTDLVWGGGRRQSWGQPPGIWLSLVWGKGAAVWGECRQGVGGTEKMMRLVGPGWVWGAQEMSKWSWDPGERAGQVWAPPHTWTTMSQTYWLRVPEKSCPNHGTDLRIFSHLILPPPLVKPTAYS